MSFKGFISFILAFAFSICGTTAQDRSVILTYPTGFRGIDLNNPHNASALNSLAAAIKECRSSNKKFKIITESYSAPENNNLITRNIGSSRSEALEDLLRERKILNNENIEFQFGGIGWNVLKSEIAKSNINKKKEILNILSYPTESTLSINVKRNRFFIIEALKHIDNGKAWNGIESSVFPLLRNTLYVITSNGDTAAVRYQPGQNIVDFNYMGNYQRLMPVLKSLSQGATGEIIYSPYPCSANEIYRNIASRRAKELIETFANKAKINPGKIVFRTGENGWEDMRELIANSDEPWRNTAVNAIENYQSYSKEPSQAIENTRLKLLKQLDNGRTYQEIKTNFFPTIRNILVVKLIVEK